MRRTHTGATSNWGAHMWTHTGATSKNMNHTQWSGNNELPHCFACNSSTIKAYLHDSQGFPSKVEEMCEMCGIDTQTSPTRRIHLQFALRIQWISKELRMECVNLRTSCLNHTKSTQLHSISRFLTQTPKAHSNHTNSTRRCSDLSNSSAKTFVCTWFDGYFNQTYTTRKNSHASKGSAKARIALDFTGLPRETTSNPSDISKQMLFQITLCTRVHVFQRKQPANVHIKGITGSKHLLHSISWFPIKKHGQTRHKLHSLTVVFTFEQQLSLNTHCTRFHVTLKNITRKRSCIEAKALPNHCFALDHTFSYWNHPANVQIKGISGSKHFLHSISWFPTKSTIKASNYIHFKALSHLSNSIDSLDFTLLWHALLSTARATSVVLCQ